MTPVAPEARAGLPATLAVLVPATPPPPEALWRETCEHYSAQGWAGGPASTTRLRFTVGGITSDTTRQQPFRIVGDHPPELLGTDHGATSVELLLAALGRCLASGWATYGAVLSVPLDALRVEVEGDVDLQGMLGLPEPGVVPPGFQEMRATYYVRSGASREQLLQVAKMSADLSPTRHSLRVVKFSSRLVIE